MCWTTGDDAADGGMCAAADVSCDDDRDGDHGVEDNDVVLECDGKKRPW